MLKWRGIEGTVSIYSGLYMADYTQWHTGVYMCYEYTHMYYTYTHTNMGENKNQWKETAIINSIMSVIVPLHMNCKSHLLITIVLEDKEEEFLH